jgi:hypothetical protein
VERSPFGFEPANKRMGHYPRKRHFFLQAGASIQPAFHHERISVANRNFRITNKQEPGSKPGMVNAICLVMRQHLIKNKNENIE